MGSISRSWKRQEKVFSSRAWRMERSSSDTLVFAHWDPCWASVLQNSKKMNFCWFSHRVYPQQGGTHFTNNKNTKTYCITQGALLNFSRISTSYLCSRLDGGLKSGHPCHPCSWASSTVQYVFSKDIKQDISKGTLSWTIGSNKSIDKGSVLSCA